jgi:hypothetical protein
MGRLDSADHDRVRWLTSVSMVMDLGKSKGKVVPVLPLTEHHAMKAYWGSGSTAPSIL